MCGCLMPETWAFLAPGRPTCSIGRTTKWEILVFASPSPIIPTSWDFSSADPLIYYWLNTGLARNFVQVFPYHCKKNLNRVFLPTWYFSSEALTFFKFKFIIIFFQARILELIAISPSRGSSQPRDRTWVSCMGLLHCRWILYHWATREAFFYSKLF